MRRWERAEEGRERAEEEARGGSGAAEAGAQAQGVPADAALSIEEKLASKRQIFAPREAFKCAAAALASTHADNVQLALLPLERHMLSQCTHTVAALQPACKLTHRTGCCTRYRRHTDISQTVCIARCSSADKGSVVVII